MAAADEDVASLTNHHPVVANITTPIVTAAAPNELAENIKLNDSASKWRVKFIP